MAERKLDVNSVSEKEKEQETVSVRMIEKKRKLFVCIIDCTKAFDRVEHDKLIEVLRKYEIQPENIRLISNLYWNQTAMVRTNNGESRTFKIKGVRQGCIISPILFNMYSEELMREALENTEGIKVNGIKTTNMRYEDDTIIIAETEEELQLMIIRLNDVCKIYGICNFICNFWQFNRYFILYAKVCWMKSTLPCYVFAFSTIDKFCSELSALFEVILAKTPQQ